MVGRGVWVPLLVGWFCKLAQDSAIEELVSYEGVELSRFSVVQCRMSQP